jgi:hypothetical protein
MDIVGLVAVLGAFITPIAIVWTVVRGPKAKAQAEIMKAKALAQLEDKCGLIEAVKAEETSLIVQEQQKRLEALEEELRFMRRLLEDKTKPGARVREG